jgi:hypothetical protein
MKNRKWVEKTGIYIKFGGKGRKGLTANPSFTVDQISAFDNIKKKTS